MEFLKAPAPYRRTPRIAELTQRLLGLGWGRLCLVLATAVCAFAKPALAQQVFPLLVTQVPPANAATLSDLTASGTSPWQVSIMLQDQRETSVQVALRVRLEGNGFSATTRAPLLAPVQTVTQGVPLILTASELAGYLAPGNLILQGIDERSFVANGATLPPGGYQLCVEVVPLGRADGSAAGESCVVFMSRSYEPPVFTRPYEGEELFTTEPQFAALAWQHRGLVPPGATYQLKIYPVDPATQIVSTADVIALIGPLVEVDVQGRTGYELDAASPNLRAGWEYIARVQVRAPDNSVRITNNGWSAPLRFRYGAVGSGGGLCPPPTNVELVHVGQNDAEVNWVLPAPAEDGISYASIDVRVGLAGDNATPWEFPADGFETSKRVERLQRARQHTLSVMGVCTDGSRSPTQQIAFTTVGDGITNNGSCDEPAESLVPPAPATGSLELKPGSIFNFHQFQVKVVNPTGSLANGYDGDATFIIPYLEQGILHVKMRGIKVVNGVAVAGILTPQRSAVAQFDPSQYAANFGDINCGADAVQVVLDEKGFLPGPPAKHYVTGALYDPNGFDVSGNYIGTPRAPYSGPTTTFDPAGFNQLGIHEETGTKANENGCDRYGFGVDERGESTGLPCDASGFNGAKILNEASEFYTSAPGEGGFADAAIGFTAQKAGVPDYVVAAGVAIAAGEEQEWEDVVVAAVLPYVSEAIGLEAADARRIYDLLRVSLDVKTVANEVAARVDVPRELLYGEDDVLLTDKLYTLFPNGLPPALPPTGRNPDILAYEAELEARYNNVKQLEEEASPTLQISLALSQKDAEEFLKGITTGMLKSMTLTEGKNLVSGANPKQKILDWLQEKFKFEIRRQVDELIAAKRAQRDAPADDDPAGDGNGWLEPHLPGGLQIVPLADAGAWASTDDAWVGIDIPRTSEVGEDDDYRQFFPPPSVDPLFGYKLPIILEHPGSDGKSYKIVLDSLKIPASTAAAGPVLFSAFTVLPVPGSERDMLVFRGENIPFGPGGMQGTDTARLSLANMVRFGLGEVGQIVLDPPTNPAADGSEAAAYVNFTCDGYAGFGLRGKLDFCRETVLPWNETTKAPEEEIISNDPAVYDAARYTVDFEAKGFAWPQFTAEVRGAQAATDEDDEPQNQRFVATAYQDIIWEAGALVIDFAEDYTPEAADFEDYDLAGSRDLWQGVYIRDIGAELVGFVERSNNTGPRGTIERLIVDASGVTTSLSLLNAVTLDEGRLGSWAISLEEARAALYKNSLEEVYFQGDVALPTGDDDILGYEGQYLASQRSDAGFSFAVTPPAEAISWKIWSATLSLNASSRFGIQRDATSGEYYAEASLYGALRAGKSRKSYVERLGDVKAGVSLEGVDFENIVLRSRAPYIDVTEAAAYVNGNAGMKLKGFGATLTQIGVRGGRDTDPGNIGLSLTGHIGLMGEEAGFSVGTSVVIWGDIGIDDNPNALIPLTFAYRDYSVEGVSIAMQIPGVYVDGALMWKRNDPKWGDGFHGRLTAKFAALGMGAKASGTFGTTTYKPGGGRVDEYAYWGVDAAMLWYGSDAPDVIFPLVLTGMGGGVSWRLGRPNIEATAFNFVDDNPNKTLVFGRSISGIVYEPDPRISLELRIMAAMATKSPAMNTAEAQAALAITFSDSWGLERIRLDGRLAFMTEANPLTGFKAAGAKPAPLYANLAIQIADEPSGMELTGSLETYLNYKVGRVSLRGNAPRGRTKDKNFLGAVQLKLGKADWFLWVGTQQTPVSLGLKSPILNATVSTYLDVGSELPAEFKPVPARYNSLGLNFDIPDARAGFAHGTEIRISNTDRNSETEGNKMKGGSKWIDFDYGFDIGYNVLVTSGQKCPRLSSYGLDGWRFTGGAYVGGSVAAKVKGKSVGSASVKAAAVLQGPNPYGGSAAAEVVIDIPYWWDYTWTGNIDFGSRCPGTRKPPEPWAGPFPKQLIVDVYPVNGNTRVAANTLPEATAVLPVGRWVRHSIKESGSGRTTTYDLKLQVESELVRTDVSSGWAVLASSGSRVGDLPEIAMWQPVGYKNLIQGGEYIFRSRARILEKYGERSRRYTWGRHDYGVWGNWVTSSFTVDNPEVPQLVQTMLPADGSEQVDVLTSVELHLRQAAFEFPRFNGVQSFMPVVDDVDLYYETSNGSLWPLRPKPNFTLGIDGGHVSIALPELAPNKRYRVKTKIALVDANGAYYNLPGTNTKYTQEASTIFTTGKRASKIRRDNIYASYPYPKQYNVYLQEPGTEQWFIEMSRSQGYLFDGARGVRESGYALIGSEPGGGDDSLLIVRYVDASTNTAATYKVATLNESGSRPRISWSQPTPAELTPGATYAMELVRVAVSQVPSATISAYSYANRGSQSVTPVGGTVLYTTQFRVSHYPSSAQKLAAYASGAAVLKPMRGQLSPDFPAGDPARSGDFIHPLGAAQLGTRYPFELDDEGDCGNLRDRAGETRYIGSVLAKAGTGTFEPFDEYELVGVRRQRLGAPGEAESLLQVSVGPLLVDASGNPLYRDTPTGLTASGELPFASTGVYQRGGPASFEGRVQHTGPAGWYAPPSQPAPALAQAIEQREPLPDFSGLNGGNDEEEAPPADNVVNIAMAENTGESSFNTLQTVSYRGSLSDRAAASIREATGEDGGDNDDVNFVSRELIGLDFTETHVSIANNTLQAAATMSTTYDQHFIYFGSCPGREYVVADDGPLSSMQFAFTSSASANKQVNTLLDQNPVSDSYFRTYKNNAASIDATAATEPACRYYYFQGQRRQTCFELDVDGYAPRLVPGTSAYLTPEKAPQTSASLSVEYLVPTDAGAFAPSSTTLIQF